MEEGGREGLKPQASGPKSQAASRKPATYRCGATQAMADNALSAMSGTACGRFAAAAATAQADSTAATPGRYRR